MLKKLSFKTFTGFFLCALSGIIVSLSFMYKNLFWLVFIGLIPLFIVFLSHKKLNKRKTFLYLCGFSVFYYSITLHWMFQLSPYINENKLKSLIIFSLALLIISIIMGCYWSISLMFYYKIRRNNIVDVITFSFLFIFGEWLQEAFYPLAFPWGRLGAIVTPLTFFIQSASLFGSLFISLLILLINGFIAYAILNIKNPKRCYVFLAVSLAIFVSDMAFGIIRYKEITKQEKTLNACIIQGNFPQLDKWSASSDEIFNLYIKTAEKHVTDDTDVVLLPETALPFDIFEDKEKYQRVLQFTKKYNTTLIIGIIHNEDGCKYNSMVAILPDGNSSDIYSKQILVPMGEMIPFSCIVSKIISKTFLDFSPYTEGDKVLILNTETAKYGGIICYESVFPSVARKSVQSGAEVLALLSNDSWFGTSPALYQHHAHAILRAVENNRYVLRCSNSAITSVISPYGKIEDTAPEYKLSVLNAGFCKKTSRTLYSYIGDVIVLPGALFFISGLIKRKKK